MIIRTHTRDVVALPLSSISSARAVKDGWIVTDVQGREHTVDDIAWDIALEGTPTATVPALPGTYLINPRDDDGSMEKVWKTNVLGWMVCADTVTRPVVIDQEALLATPWSILHPDGRVERSDGRSWDTLDEWLEEIGPVLARAEAEG